MDPSPSNAGMRRALVSILLAAGMGASPGGAKLPAEAPPLPPPDAAVFTIIEVDTAQKLADACWNLQSDQAIVIAAGDYDLKAVSFPNGVDGRLTVGRFGAAPISNIQIRGATGNPQDVVIHGAGMLAPIVPFGFQIFTATDVLIADLSVGNVYYHSVAIQGDQGAARVRLYNARIFDAGQQIVKASGGDADDVTIEYCEIFHSAGAVVHPEGSPPNSCYTNGIDAIGVSGWAIRDNLIHGIYCRNNALAGPSILVWQGSAGTIVERNTILDGSRGISLGLGTGDHSGGVVRNNFIRWDPNAAYQVDVPIYTTSPGSLVLHNTALTRGRYANAVEVRFSSTTGVRVEHNLLDAQVAPRDGAAPSVADNLQNAQPGWFVDEAAGDLHLLPTAAPAIDQVSRLPEVVDDFSGASRPAGAGETDLGAAELTTLVPIFADGFESGDLSGWSAATGI